MYRQFYGLTREPFSKEIAPADLFLSKDVLEFRARMDLFRTMCGIAIVFGEPGTGKTTALRAFVHSLNPQTHAPVYLPLSTLTVTDFYRHLAIGLGLIPRFRKVDLFHQIQLHIANQNTQKGQVPVIIIDEAQFLRHDLLHDLQMIMNFSMDSKNPAMMILTGTPPILQTVKLYTHEALLQRIVMHHEFTGLTDDEVGPYIQAMLKAAGTTSPIFTPDAITGIAQFSRGTPRLVCQLAAKCLILGYGRQARSIDSSIVQDAMLDTPRITLKA